MDAAASIIADCVGALDGTYVRATVPIATQGSFHGRKYGTPRNVLAAITFDLKFTYVLAGWEGSAHDSHVLNDALTRSGGFKIPGGKYYLVTMLLEILFEEANKGNKPSNTFKWGSFAQVAKEINEKLGTVCQSNDVENQSGFGWDDNLNMITCDRKARPEHEQYLKKIEFYDEMDVVVGRDMATGNFAKPFVDIDVEEKIAKSIDFEMSHKRNHRDQDDSDDKLSEQIGEVALAIKKLTEDRVNVNDLYEEVMKSKDMMKLCLPQHLIIWLKMKR
ncbi:unnamed protein product [Camellia sinensis]